MDAKTDRLVEQARDRFDAVRTDVRDRIERLDPGLSAATRETAKSMWERYEEALKRRKR